MSEHMSPIPSRIYNAAVGGHVCGPDDIDFGQKVVHLIKYDRAGNEVSFESQVTQTNKIYVIHDDFVLSSDVTIPANCVLEFDGGSISGAHTITGQNTILNNASADCMHGISLAGTFKGEVAHINWLHNTGENISANMQTLVNSYDKIIIDKGTFYITDTVILRSGVTIKGESREQSIIKASVERYLVGDYMYTMFSTAELTLDAHGYRRRGNLDNVNNDILYSDIEFSNLTIDFNRHNSDFPAPNYLSIAFCNFLYLLDAKDCIVKDITFIDYQEYVNENEIYTNASKCVYSYNSECSKIINCSTTKCTLVMFQKGNHNEAAFNKGTNSIGTWIETIESPYVHIHDNELTNLYWGDSMMSTNGKYGIIENNKIINNNNVDNSSAFTFGHSSDETDASYGIFRNNYVHLVKGENAVLVQRGSNIIIEGNNITLLTQNTDSEESWRNWRYKDYGAITVRSKVEHSVISIKNNNIYCGTYCGIYAQVNNNDTNNKVIDITNNVIYGYTNSITLNGLYSSVNITNNTLKTEYNCILCHATPNNCLIEANTLNGQVNTLCGHFINNTIDMSGKTKFSEDNCIDIPLDYVTRAKCKNNIFKNIPTASIRSLFYVAGDYNGFFEERSISNIIGDNVFDSDYDSKVMFCNLRKDNAWREFYIKKPIIQKRGDHTQVTPSTFEEGVTIYDELLHKDVLWNGSSWVNVDGSALS